MQYRKIIVVNTIIEFHNSWLGEETVIVNGQRVSRKSSILGTDHYFQVEEEGKLARYVLTTKVGDLVNVLIDLKRNGKYIERDLPVPLGFGDRKTQSKLKKQGLLKLRDYDLDAALEIFRRVLDENPSDPEVYFHMACAYSVQEKAAEGFDSLKKAVELHLPDKEMIFQHDMLAFLRMHPAFESFVKHGFTAYDAGLLEDPPGQD